MRPTSVAPVELELPQIFFYNGTRYPIVLQHLLLSPVGYTLERYLNPPIVSAAAYRNAMGAALECEVRVTAPGRKHMSRRTVDVGGYRPRPTSLPRAIVTPALGDPYEAGSVFGLSTWEFDFPNDDGMVLPRLSTIAFNISGYTFPSVGLNTPETATPLVRAHAAFYERSDSFWGRRARWSGPMEIQPKAPKSGVTDLYPVSPAVVPPDGFGFNAPANAQPQVNLAFDAKGVYKARRFMQEEGNIGTEYDRFCGFAVMLDQITLDNYMQGQNSTAAGQALAPLSQRVALKANVSSGGTGEDWFDRGGAPVSLCCPTINEAAVVHDFDDPITLDPNAGLRVDIRTPGGLDVLEAIYPGIYNLGVSVVGYAIIEGGP